jgi:pyridoxamine 5'-phosphate oxidase
MSPRRPDLPPLRRADLAADPFEQFAAWFERAAEEAPLAEAITLATVDPEGAPDARMVLLKGFGPDGFRFFTNYESAKASQLESAGRAAIVVYWRELDQQVRARGSILRLPAEDSDAYFADRPRDARLSAWASPQSRPLEHRDELERRLAEADERFEGTDVPRPDNWGGYLLEPTAIEFWQGQAHRLHDRFRYERAPDGSWAITRLAP